MKIERTDADLMHLERRITALEGRSRNILLRLHDKIVGRGPLADRRAKDAHVVAAGNLPPSSAVKPPRSIAATRCTHRV